MNTNHLMMQELLKQYHPKERGIISNEEMKLVEETLCLSEMGILSLRNLRDYVVLKLSRSEKMEDWDRMSAITFCIDLKIINLGGEV